MRKLICDDPVSGESAYLTTEGPAQNSEVLLEIQTPDGLSNFYRDDEFVVDSIHNFVCLGIIAADAKALLCKTGPGDAARIPEPAPEQPPSAGEVKNSMYQLNPRSEHRARHRQAFLDQKKTE